ncbi:MAG: hypothetical protein JNL29_01940 [Nitrospira sp.]|jgi:predicted HicB family RNase H-like nuclease|nr:hypothetical protein [Nitrospira sp.]
MTREKATAQKKTFGLRLNQELMKELSHLAVDKERWVNDLVDEAIRDLLKKYQKQK